MIFTVSPIQTSCLLLLVWIPLFISLVKCIDVVYRMQLDFHCSEEMVVLGILYYHNEKKNGDAM